MKTCGWSFALWFILCVLYSVCVYTHEEAQEIEYEVFENATEEVIVNLEDMQRTPPTEEETRTYQTKSPMGWTTYSIRDQSSSGYLDEDRIDTAVRWLSDSKLHDMGYSLIVIDGQWWAAERDLETQELVADTAKFPAGLGRLAGGLKDREGQWGLGLRVPLGPLDCDFPKPDFQTMETSDAAQFKNFGVQYIKLRACVDNTNLQMEHGDESPVAYAYSKWEQALKASPQTSIDAEPEPVDAIFSTCSIATIDDPINFDSCESWEIYDKSVSPATLPFHQVAGTVEFWANNNKNVPLLESKKNIAAEYLYIGSGLMTYDQEKTQMSFWCIMSIPLIITSDASSASKESMSLLLNQNAVNVHQDGIERFGNLYNANLLPGTSVWTRRVGFGHATLVINLGETFVESELLLASVIPAELLSSGDLVVRDIWENKTLVSNVASDTFVHLKLEPCACVFMIATSATYDSSKYSEPEAARGDTFKHIHTYTNSEQNETLSVQEKTSISGPEGTTPSNNDSKPTDISYSYESESQQNEYYLPNKTSEIGVTSAEGVENTNTTGDYYIIENKQDTDTGGEEEGEALQYSNVTNELPHGKWNETDAGGKDNEVNNYLVSEENKTGEEKTFLAPRMQNEGNSKIEISEENKTGVSAQDSNSGDKKTEMHTNDINSVQQIADADEGGGIEAMRLEQEAKHSVSEGVPEITNKNINEEKPEIIANQQLNEEMPEIVNKNSNEEMSEIVNQTNIQKSEDTHTDTQGIEDMAKQLREQSDEYNNININNVNEIQNDQIKWNETSIKIGDTDTHTAEDRQRLSGADPQLRHIDSMAGPAGVTISSNVENKIFRSRMFVWGIIGLALLMAVLTKVRKQVLSSGYERIDTGGGGTVLANLGRHED